MDTIMYCFMTYFHAVVHGSEISSSLLHEVWCGWDCLLLQKISQRGMLLSLFGFAAFSFAQDCNKFKIVTMECSKMYKESLFSMETETFDRFKSRSE